MTLYSPFWRKQTETLCTQEVILWQEGRGRSPLSSLVVAPASAPMVALSAGVRTVGQKASPNTALTETEWRLSKDGEGEKGSWIS